MKKAVILILVLSVCLLWMSTPVLARDQRPADTEILEWQVGPTIEPFDTVNLDDQPQTFQLTDEQIELSKLDIEFVNRYPENIGERISDAPELSPNGNEETIDADEYSPQAGNWMQVITHGFSTSELYRVAAIAEPSVAVAQMKKAFMTYNWGAAQSSDHGLTWTKVDPYTIAIPSGYRFCCDQEVVFDPVYNTHYWVRLMMSNSGPGGALVLGVSNNTNKWWFYTLWANHNKLPDFPHLQLSHNFLYITFNEFVPGYTRAVVSRYPLLAMARAKSLSGSYFQETGWFNIMIARNHRFNGTMYAASNIPQSGTANRVKVYEWDEHKNTIPTHTITVAAWNYGGGMHCPCPSVGDPCQRADDRILGAAVAYNKKFPESGKNQLWLAWNSKPHGSFIRPYIYMLQINVDTWAVLDYDPVWRSDSAFLYPRLAVNGVGDICFVSDRMGGLTNTNFIAFILDGDLQDYDAGYYYHTIAHGTTCSNEWGDYNDVGPWWRNSLQCVACGHVRSVRSQPWYVRFTNSVNFP